MSVAHLTGPHASIASPVEPTSLDAVMTGCAFEEATSAIRVLEEGSGGKNKISAPMMCTLDNFIQVFLFNERIFLTGSAHEQGGRISCGRALNRCGPEGRSLLDDAGVFAPLMSPPPDMGRIGQRVGAVLNPVDSRKTDWFVISCTHSGTKLTIHQEMLCIDALLMEVAIEQCGVEKFKPTFPGEHLYLGLRQNRLRVPKVTRGLPDLAAHRIRDAMRTKMERMNAFVSFGGQLLPELSPLFLSRIVGECRLGRHFVPVLLEVRNSSAMRRFRMWLAKCNEQLCSPDPGENAKAHKALEKFNSYPLDQAVDPKAAGLSTLSVVKDVATMDVIGFLGDIAGPILNLFLSAPFSGLSQFGGKKADAAKLDAFLMNSFGDGFTWNEMNMISNFLKLPSNLTDWSSEGSLVSAAPGRIDLKAELLSRPYLMSIRDPQVLSELESRIAGRLAKA